MTPQQTIEALIKKGFTYYSIAKETGLNQTTLARWHRDKTNPKSKLMVKILKEYAKGKI